MSRKKNFKDFIGKKYGRLTVFGESKIRKFKGVTVECLCDCGSEFLATISSLISGNTKSCGCIEKEKNNNYRHGLKKDPLYSVWANMKQRCYNKNFPKYNDLWRCGL